jgi:anti-anti-sigma factor
MKITRTDHEAAIVVQLDGYLGGATAGELESYLKPLLTNRSKPNILIDLSDVTELSSAGLRVLISAIKRVRSNKSGDIRLAAPSKRVVEVLELAGLLTVINLYPSLEAAVASFDQSSTS